jgi:hypothetical protein
LPSRQTLVGMALGAAGFLTVLFEEVAQKE